MQDIVAKIAEFFPAIANGDYAEIRRFLLANHSVILRSGFNGQTYSDSQVLFYVLRWVARKHKTIENLLFASVVSDTIENAAFCYSNGIATNVCENGNRRKFNRQYSQGLIYCGNDSVCKCKRDNHSLRARSKTPGEKAAIQAKKVVTSMQKFGTDNPMRAAVVRQKCKDAVSARTDHQMADIKALRETTMLGRYGVKNGFQNEDIKQKSNKTILARYGCGNIAAVPEIREKMENTLYERTGFRNVFSNPAVIEETQRKNSINKDEIITKIKATTQKNHGVDFYLQKLTPEQRNNNQSHYTAIANEVLMSEENFRAFIVGKALSTVAKQLDVYHSTICDYCHKYGIELERNRSTYEVEVERFLKDNNISYFRNSRHVIPPQELDFYIPAHDLAIEFNGLFYHSDSEKGKPRDYHIRKMRACHDKGLRLVSINEDEWLMRADAVKLRILNICGKSERGVGARKLSIRRIPVNDAQDFVSINHIQGRVYNVICAYGAHDGADLVGVVTFSSQRGTNMVELSRFCTDGKIYAGLFSRMFSRAVKEQSYATVVTFADRRYSEGNLYYATGFAFSGTTPIDYRYVKGAKTFHKQSLTKKNIEKRYLIDISGKTETQLTRELGFHRIYDCGKLRFVWGSESCNDVMESPDQSVASPPTPRVHGPARKPMGVDAAKILGDRRALVEHLQIYSVHNLARLLDVSRMTVSRRIKKLNISRSEYPRTNGRNG